MNSNRCQACQTSRWLLAALLWTGILRAADPAPSAPPPAPWQTELDADRALQASLLLAPAKDAAEGAARRQVLATRFRQLAARYPDAFPVQKAAGDCMAQLETLPAALPFWLQAGKLDPKNAEVADSLGSAYVASGQVRLASEQFQRAVTNQPNVASYHSDLANVLYLFRQELLSPPTLQDEQAILRLALEHFRLAASLSPGDLPLAKAYAETFYIFPEPDWAAALAAWQNVRALSGGDTDLVNIQLARVSLRLKRRADAEGYLGEVRSVGFTDLKAKLLQQASRLPLPSPTP